MIQKSVHNTHNESPFYLRANLSMADSFAFFAGKLRAYFSAHRTSDIKVPFGTLTSQKPKNQDLSRYGNKAHFVELLLCHVMMVIVGTYWKEIR